MTNPPRALFRRWVHVREEDRPGVRVYRPADRPLPPARGREGLEFRPDGTVIGHRPGPVDIPVGTPGRWRAANTGQLRLTFAPEREMAFDIVDVNDDVLHLRPLAD